MSASVAPGPGRRGAGRSALRRLARGFTLIELMIAVAVVGILLSIALPAYQDQVRRSSREAAQAQLVELASLQERIFLNGNAYTANVTAAYNGTAAGGLGVTSGRTRDNKYTLTAAAAGATFTLTATPVAGSTQASDGTLTINAAGHRTWAGTKTW